MAIEAPNGSDPGLDGLWDRIPAATGITTPKNGGIAALRAGWQVRHTIALVVLTPLLYLLYWWAAGATRDILGMLLTAAMALAGAFLLTSYLPMRGVTSAGASCALMPALFVPAVAVLLSQGGAAGGWIGGVGILALGLYQRVSGTSACN
jgi:hypothetical protein